MNVCDNCHGWPKVADPMIEARFFSSKCPLSATVKKTLISFTRLF